MKRITAIIFIVFTGISACKNTTIQSEEPDSRIYDQWVLSSIDGEEIMPTGEKPKLEFKEEEKGITGFGGCNNISANTTLDAKTIRFGPIISTKMTCPNQPIEDHFMEFLSQPPLSYEINNGTLILTNATGKLVFKKTE